MKRSILLITGLYMISILSCKKQEDDSMATKYDYHAHITSPNTDDKHLDDNIHIRVNFESHTGETVHHVNVRIYNKATSAEVYNQPTDAHVHETSGEYVFEDDFVLSEANGISAHTDWILEARVWGHEANEEEVQEQIEFHVHPK